MRSSLMEPDFAFFKESPSPRSSKTTVKAAETAAAVQQKHFRKQTKLNTQRNLRRNSVVGDKLNLELRLASHENNMTNDRRDSRAEVSPDIVELLSRMHSPHANAVQNQRSSSNLADDNQDDSVPAGRTSLQVFQDEPRANSNTNLLAFSAKNSRIRRASLAMQPNAIPGLIQEGNVPNTDLGEDLPRRNSNITGMRRSSLVPSAQDQVINAGHRHSISVGNSAGMRRSSLVPSSDLGDDLPRRNSNLAVMRRSSLVPSAQEQASNAAHRHSISVGNRKSSLLPGGPDPTQASQISLCPDGQKSRRNNRRASIAFGAETITHYDLKGSVDQRNFLHSTSRSILNMPDEEELQGPGRNSVSAVPLAGSRRASSD